MDGYRDLRPDGSVRSVGLDWTVPIVDGDIREAFELTETIMRLKLLKDGYVLWLSERETEAWSARWPCSTLRGRRICVEVDGNGLHDLSVDGRAGECDAGELQACVADHLPPAARRFWPTWET